MTRFVDHTLSSNRLLYNLWEC